MKKKNAKKILIGISVISMIGLVGCSNTNDSKGESEKYHDEQMAIINDTNNTKETGMAEEVKSYDEYGTGEDSNSSSNNDIDKCLNDLKFEKYDEQSTIKYYKCDATNTTYKDYAFVDLKAELLDENGESLGIVPILGLNGWKAGETKELTFSTIKNFSNIKYHHEEY